MLTSLPAWAGDQRDPSELRCGRCQRARISRGAKPHRQALALGPVLGAAGRPLGPQTTALCACPPLFQPGGGGGRGARAVRVAFLFARGCNAGRGAPLHSVCCDKPRPLRHRCLPLSFTGTPRAARGGTPSPATAQRSATRPGGPCLCPLKLPREPLAAHKESEPDTGVSPAPAAGSAGCTHTHPRTRIHTHGAAGRVTYLQVPVRGSAGRGAVLYRPYCMGG